MWRANPVEQSLGFRAWADGAEEQQFITALGESRCWYESTSGGLLGPGVVSLYQEPGWFSVIVSPPPGSDRSPEQWLGELLGLDRTGMGGR